jgi:CRP-like cAMP-binding protein
VDFLERFSDRDRARLVEAAVTQRLQRGEHLLRRGERGGDIYRVVEGELEVIDDRQQPAVVLDVVGKGAVLGEMAFVDEAPRTADVRAAEHCVCQRWDRHRLLHLFEQDPGLGAAFYRAIAESAVARHRHVTTNAMAGTISAAKKGRAGTDAANELGRHLAAGVRRQLVTLEPSIRRDPAGARRDLTRALHNLHHEVAAQLAPLPVDEAAAAGQAFAQDLHPYVMRSQLGELANDKLDGHCGSTDVITHIVRNQPAGDGPLGEMLDAWLLSLPSAHGLRERAGRAAELLVGSLPAEPPLRVLAVNHSAAILLAPHVAALGRVPGELTVVDASRDALARVEAALTDRPRSLQLRLAHVDLFGMSLGRPRITFQPQHAVVIDGMLEYLPERVTIAILRWARQQLRPGGALVATAILPSDDDPLFRHLLDWPMIRRARGVLVNLAESAGFGDVRAYDAGSAGVVLAGWNG